jgi:TNF receptor-associated protein 1
MADNKPKTKTLKFKTEVAQVLNIVVNSLYTDKEIFIRELISNASDALEKMRHLQLIHKDEYADQDLPLEIRILANEDANTFTITDTGLGMTEEEASGNLGTIAHSGSKDFIKAMEGGENVDLKNIIGQFGVGFYSAFMVGKKVTVHTRSWDKEATPIVWSSTGSGSYSIRETESLPRGTTITIDLKEDEKEYSKADTVKELIRRYSNFIPVPIFVDDEQVNTVQPLWTKQKSDISDEEMVEFYKFIANAYDEPLYKYHFSADAPLAIKSLLFVPATNMESFGFGRMEPSVSLYCRKVLIQSGVEELLPEYFRFIKGMVDSEDLPLNISRESMQDSALIAKLKRVLTKRLIKFFTSEMKNSPEEYDKFFKMFGMFIKEGAASDHDNKDALAKLLKFSSSKEAEKTTSFEEYVENMPEDQKAIYYISGINRESIEAGPYTEALTERGYEVIYCHEGIDDFVMTSLREFDGKKLISADQSNLEFGDDNDENKDDESDDKKDEKSEGKETSALAGWIKGVFGETIKEVVISKRLIKSPAVLVNPDDHMTTGMRRVMQATSKEIFQTNTMILEINPEHYILSRINELLTEDKDSKLAKEASMMLLDNAMIAAGLMVDPKSLVERSTKILETALAK